MDEYEPIKVEIPREIFNNEVKDFGIHVVENFINSDAFKRDFELANHKIIPRQAVI
jgi:hypothetical protein